MKDKRVLIVDFDEDSLISLSNLVYEEGFTAVTASDGLTGYEKFKADDFDLVIIEPMLPKLHGFELCKRINQDPVKKAPIVVVTGIYREPSCKREALEVYGASAFFTKPWNKDELRSKMLQLLIEGKRSSTEKGEAPHPPAKTLTPDDWGLLKTPPPFKEPKLRRGLDDIEQKLREALSDSVAPGRKKEVAKEKKEPQVAVDREVEAMLRGAIGTLGFEDKKKAREPARHAFRRSLEPFAAKLESPARPAPAAEPTSAAKPAPAFKPTSAPQPDFQPEKGDRIPIAKEIKDRIPVPEKAGNNIPRSALRAQLDSDKPAFSIDQTLIEIDKIPLGPDQSSGETKKAAPAREASRPEKKKAFFDEYAEPAKKRPATLIIGVAAAVVVFAAGAGFFILRSKKTGPPAGQIISSLQPSLPAEFSVRQNEIPASELAGAVETKEEPKKAPSEPAEESSEVVGLIQPDLPTETPAVQLQEQPASNPDAAGREIQSTTAPGVEVEVQKDAPGKSELSSPPQGSEPSSAKVKLGDLVALTQVDVPPALIRKVGPKYPTLGFSQGVGGTVTVNALISENGDVVRTEILKGIKGAYGFEKSAESAIRQWKFRPAEKDGVRVKVWKPVDINF
ncbi:MAG: TonB family protein, partial [Acidobacteriota bacterium]